MLLRDEVLRMMSRPADEAQSVTAYPGGWRPVRYEQRCSERRALLEVDLQRAIEACRGLPNVVRLLVFGSFARGEVSPWSDLDLLVVADGDAVCAVDALNAIGLFGDVLGMSGRDSSQRLARTAFGQTILAEGIGVYARSAG